mgnify:CR=1 FL=1
MVLWKRLRYKWRAIVRYPRIYAWRYGLAFFLRGCLFLVEFVFLRIFIYLPFRLADLSLREIMQHLRRMDIHFWSFLRSAFTRLLDVGHWVQGLGRFSSLPEALRYVNARLSDWLYWKRERLLVIIRSLKSPREIYRHIRRFLDEHFRNIRLLRRSAVGAVLGIVLNRFNVSMIAFNYDLPSAERYFPSIWEICISMFVVTMIVTAYRFIVYNMPVLYEHPHFRDEH